jgi:hypothetical protein
MGNAVAGLLGTVLVSLAAISALVVWHLVRRGRLLRDRIGPPRTIPRLELPDQEGDSHDQDPNDVPTP